MCPCGFHVNNNISEKNMGSNCCVAYTSMQLIYIDPVKLCTIYQLVQEPPLSVTSTVPHSFHSVCACAAVKCASTTFWRLMMRKWVLCIERKKNNNNKICHGRMLSKTKIKGKTFSSTFSQFNKFGGRDTNVKLRKRNWNEIIVCYVIHVFAMFDWIDLIGKLHLCEKTSFCTWSGVHQLIFDKVKNKIRSLFSAPAKKCNLMQGETHWNSPISLKKISKNSPWPHIPNKFFEPDGYVSSGSGVRNLDIDCLLKTTTTKMGKKRTKKLIIEKVNPISFDTKNLWKSSVSFCLIRRIGIDSVKMLVFPIECNAVAMRRNAFFQALLASQA